MLIVFTAIVGMFLAAPGLPPGLVLLFGTIGIALAASSAAAINHVLDRRFDEQMARTRNRPLPTGHVTERQALVYALILAVLSMLILWILINPLTAVLTFGSLIGYAVIYTGYLKRATPQNIVIGGLAGAAPPLLGWAAVKGWPAGLAFADLAGAPLHYDHALLLVLIIYVWTPPHFWALAIHRRDDYARASVPMLPVTHGVAHTSRRILQYCIVLLPVSLLPVALGTSGGLYAAGAVALGLRFIDWARRLRRDAALALPTFRFSIVYLAARVDSASVVARKLREITLETDDDALIRTDRFPPTPPR